MSEKADRRGQLFLTFEDHSLERALIPFRGYEGAAG
jgi:hypothetical protein